MQDDVKSQVKKRLCDLVKTAVGSLVVAAATLNTPAAEPAKSAAPETSLEERVQQVREQNAVSDVSADNSEEALAAFHNWGNHWNNWNNWHNWHNWHNFHY